jgi:long-chain acyl-CoA synthetase
MDPFQIVRMERTNCTWTALFLPLGFLPMRTIWSLWQEALAENRIHPAYLVEVDGEWRAISQQEAATVVDELAHGLLAIGLRKGDAFGILARTRLEWVLLDFALAQIGAVAAPIYPSSTAAEACYVLEHSKAVGALVEDDEQLAKIDKARPEHVYTLDTLNELRAAGREHAAAQPNALDDARARIGDDDLFTFIYTSGTTGPPKACMILNRNYYEMVGMIDRIENFFLPTDVMLLYLPLAHNFGRLMHLLGAHLGYTIAFLPDPRRIGDVMPQVRPTVLPTVPRVLEKVHTGVTANFAAATGAKRRLIDWALDVGGEVSLLRQRREPVPRGLALKHRVADRLVYSKVKERLGGRLRAAISGGAPLAKEIAEFFHALDILILEGYGQTEETTASNVNRPTHFKFGTVGPALPGIDVTTAEDGEILIKSPTVFAGYYNDEEATRAALPGDGWLHTGDVGVIDEDGFLTVTDRKKDIIVTAGGKNVSPQNIENLLKGIPWVSQALVVGDRRPYVAALITLDDEEVAKLDGDEGVTELVRRAVDEINADLAHFEQVRRFEILDRDFSADENEITPTLKLKRRVVEEHFAPQLERLYSD